MSKINVAVLFGGETLEKDVSIATGKQTIKHLNEKKYNILPIYIDENYNWWLIKYKQKNININNCKKYEVVICPGKNLFYFNSVFKNKIKIHCAIICLHGGKGENGTVSGLLDVCKIPHTASNLLSSSLTMDKNLTKILLKENYLNVLPYITLDKKENFANKLKKFIKEINFPLVVKPCNMGSSLGVTFVNSEKKLQQAINLAFSFSEKIIIEKGIKKVKEFNCSAMQIKNEILVSDIEKPIHKSNILTFAEKYGTKLGIKNESSTNASMEFLGREFPAQITKVLEHNIKQLTTQVYKLFNCSGIIRCDFIYYNKKIYLNEINSIPGSLAYYLWKNKGYSFSALLDELISNSIHNNLQF